MVSYTVKSTNSRNQIFLQQVNEHKQSLLSLDQKRVCLNCPMSLRDLWKQLVSQWAADDNYIFKSELGLDVERGAHIMSNIGRVQTTSHQAYKDFGQYFHSRFEKRKISCLFS